ncbi:MAG: hypothetical protein R6W77_12240 [Trueperaceae bacterium]
MSDQLRMHTPNEPRATGSREAEHCELDLTSVCVRSGVVRLPQRMLSWFTNGVIAQADGEELALSFEPPRALHGLTSFIAANELRANDRICFTFEDGVVHLSAVRRERKRPGAAQLPSRWLSAREAVPEGGVDRRDLATRAPDARHEVETDPTLGAANAGMVASVRTVAAGESSAAPNAAVPAATKAPRANDGRADTAREPWGVSDTSVRAVRRVRIEGGPAPTASAHAPQPVDTADARQVWAKNHQARWRPLDALDSEPVEPAEDSGPAYPETTVRVIRRGAQTPSALSTWNPAIARSHDASERNSAEKGAADRSHPGTERSRATPAPERSSGATHQAPPAIPRPTPERLHPTPKAAGPGAAEERRGGFLGSLARLSLRFQGERDDRASSLDEPERERVAAEPVPVPVRASPPGHARAEARYAEAPAPQAAPTHAGGPSRRSTAVDDDAFGDGFLDIDDIGGEERGSFGATSATRSPLAPESSHRSPANPRHEPAGARAVTQDARPRDAVGPSSDAGRPEKPSFQPSATASSSSERATDDVPARLEDDLELMAAFLARPATPAIVRAERVAEELGMSTERAERALDRMSENRERFDRIRPGAYMVRQRQRP